MKIPWKFRQTSTFIFLESASRNLQFCFRNMVNRIIELREYTPILCNLILN